MILFGPAHCARIIKQNLFYKNKKHVPPKISPEYLIPQNTFRATIIAIFILSREIIKPLLVKIEKPNNWPKELDQLSQSNGL